MPMPKYRWDCDSCGFTYIGPWVRMIFIRAEHVCGEPMSYA